MSNRNFDGWTDPLTGKPLSALSSRTPGLTERIDAIINAPEKHHVSCAFPIPPATSPREPGKLEQKTLDLKPAIKEYSPPAAATTPDYELMKVLKAGFVAQTYLKEKVFRNLKTLNQQRDAEDEPEDKLTYVRAARNVLHVRRYYLLELQKFVDMHQPLYDASRDTIIQALGGIRDMQGTVLLKGVEQLANEYCREDQLLVEKIKAKRPASRRNA